MPDKPDLPIHAFPSRAELIAWLAEHGGASQGIRIKFAKKHTGLATVSKPEAIDAALCVGWIDGQQQPYDDRFWLVRFTPRRPRSVWSEKNRTRVLELIDEGRMTPAGMAQVELARSDGRWDRAYAPASTITVPDDLRRALDADPAAAAFFASLDGANRYAVLYRVHDAKKPETRARRIARFVAMLGKGERLHP